MEIHTVCNTINRFVECSLFSLNSCFSSTLRWWWWKPCIKGNKCHKWDMIVLHDSSAESWCVIIFCSHQTKWIKTLSWLQKQLWLYWKHLWLRSIYKIGNHFNWSRRVCGMWLKMLLVRMLSVLEIVAYLDSFFLQELQDFSSWTLNTA